MRKKSGRQSGGQPGHPGRTLEFREDPQHTEVHPLREYTCGEDLSRAPALDFERRQVFDLPALQIECTEHRAEIKECPGCHQRITAAFPEEVKAPVQYGRNFRALLAYLYDAQLGASLRIRQMCEEIFGQAVSDGTDCVDVTGVNRATLRLRPTAADYVIASRLRASVPGKTLDSRPARLATEPILALTIAVTSNRSSQRREGREGRRMTGG